jgi:hypothetical protein
MFFGTNPQIISQWLVRQIQRKKPARVIAPYAGNFVIEQLAALSGKNIEIISTDVSLYSRAIGYGITDTPSEIRIRPEYLDDFPFIQGKTSPIETAATIVFMAEVAVAKKKSHIPYYQRLYQEGVEGQERYFLKIMDKLKTLRELCGHMDFRGTCGVELIDQEAQEGDWVYFDPPVAIGDYEKMFKQLEEMFDFSEPDYSIVTEEVKNLQLRMLCDIGATVFYRRNDHDASYDFLRKVFLYQYKHRGWYTIYTNDLEADMFVGRFKPLKEEQLKVPIIGPDHEITENSEIDIVQVKSTVGNHYRMLWVKKAQMTDAGTAFLCFIDKKLIGMFQLDSSLKFGSDWALINSDPGAPTSSYKKLSKLILYLICTEENLRRFNEMSVWEHKGFTTKVFTNNPVSMKYRGELFKLASREEDDDGQYRYNLIYRSKKLYPTYREALKRWLKKHGQKK